MPEFKDTHHRDHARHTGEVPTTEVDRGPYGLKVTLDIWGPWDPKVMNMYLQSNWGEHPMTYTESHTEQVAHAGVLPMVEDCFKGHTLAQILEGISFWFTIDGCTRASTHQIVRTRDAAFMQHGGRDNDWRHRRFSMPETISRLCRIHDHMCANRYKWLSLKGEERATMKMDTYRAAVLAHGQPVVGEDPDAFFRFVEREYPGTADKQSKAGDLTNALLDTIDRCKRLYAALVDSGVPWQDARRFLPIGLQTYIHGIYNYRTLQQTLTNRLELIMDWEYNCIGQLMVREIRRRCPATVAAPIKSASDKAMKAAFADLLSWPPDGKYPATPEQLAKARAHRPEQNPFWILTDDALNGGDIEWIQTDGVYPHDNPKAPRAYKP